MSRSPLFCSGIDFATGQNLPIGNAEIKFASVVQDESKDLRGQQILWHGRQSTSNAVKYGYLGAPAQVRSIDESLPHFDPIPD